MHNLKPKKYLGQHFLTDQGIAEQIVSTLQAGPENQVIEIGPGEGVLTTFLLDRYAELLLVEVDEAAVAFLKRRFTTPKLRILQADILKWDMEAELPKNAIFIGNLPYNISSPIFFRLLDVRDLVQEGVFMVQKEVAQRICSQAGNKTYGILSVLLGAYFELSYAFTVPPSVFRPPPKVDSGVLRMSRRTDSPSVTYKTLKRVVKQAFNQRRKTLRNALKSLDVPDFNGKDELWTRRAEQLSVDEFILIAQALEGKG